MDFACELMDLCRGTQEVQAILGGEHTESSKDPLARLKLAIHYGEKKVRILCNPMSQNIAQFFAFMHIFSFVVANKNLYCLVRGSSKLSATPDGLLVRKGYGVSSNSSYKQENSPVNSLSAILTISLHLLHNRSKAQGKQNVSKSSFDFYASVQVLHESW